MTKLAVNRPFDEGDLHDDLGLHPMRAQPRQPGPSREGRPGDLGRVEPRAQLPQQLPVESGANLSRAHDIAVLEISAEQRAGADPPASGIGEAADDELLRRLALPPPPA